MKKVIKLTESDLIEIVKNVIAEQATLGVSCKNEIPYHNHQLKLAIEWWKKWLNNSITKGKFAKLFNYDSATVEKHFAHYNKILGQIKLEHVDDKSKNNGAWVKPGFLQRVGFTDGGYGIPITINCHVIGSYGDIQSVMVHEIQHILDSYHKFHPYKDEDDNIFTFYNNIVKDAFNKLDPKGADTNETLRIKKALTVNGFPKNEIDWMVRQYNNFVKGDVLHLKDANEITSSLMEVRHILGIKPGQKITKQALINSIGISDVLIFIFQWLYSKQPLEKFLGYQNSIAMNNTNTDGSNLA